MHSDSMFAGQNAYRYISLYCGVGAFYADTGICLKTYDARFLFALEPTHRWQGLEQDRHALEARAPEDRRAVIAPESP